VKRGVKKGKKKHRFSSSVAVVLSLSVQQGTWSWRKDFSDGRLCDDTCNNA
jgi:hypothetical protein